MAGFFISLPAFPVTFFLQLWTGMKCNNPSGGNFNRLSVLRIPTRTRPLLLDLKGPEVAELYFLTRRQCLTDGVEERFYQGFTVVDANLILTNGRLCFEKPIFQNRPWIFDEVLCVVGHDNHVQRYSMCGNQLVERICPGVTGS